MLREFDPKMRMRTDFADLDRAEIKSGCVNLNWSNSAKLPMKDPKERFKVSFLSLNYGRGLSLPAKVVEFAFTVVTAEQLYPKVPTDSSGAVWLHLSDTTKVAGLVKILVFQDETPKPLRKLELPPEFNGINSLPSIAQGTLASSLPKEEVRTSLPDIACN